MTESAPNPYAYHDSPEGRSLRADSSEDITLAEALGLDVADYPDRCKTCKQPIMQREDKTWVHLLGQSSTGFFGTRRCYAASYREGHGWDTRLRDGHDRPLKNVAMPEVRGGIRKFGALSLVSSDKRPDWAAMYSARSPVSEGDDDLGPLTPRTAVVLHSTLQFLGDMAAGEQAWEDFAERLPRIMRTPDRGSEFSEVFFKLADDLATGEGLSPNSTAEEMALHLAIESAHDWTRTVWKMTVTFLSLAACRSATASSAPARIPLNTVAAAATIRVATTTGVCAPKSYLRITMS